MVVEIAGIRVLLEIADASLRRAVEERYAAFLTTGEPDLSWTVDVRPREHSIEDEAIVEHRGGTRYELRYGSVEADFDLGGGAGVLRVPGNALRVDSALRMTLPLLLLERNGLLLHACGFVRGGRAFVLFGPSGAGKTTIARMAPAADVLSDEIVAITVDGAGIRAHGTPFYGDLGISNPLSAPVAALARLYQGPERLDTLSPAAATTALLNSALFFCHSPTVTERLMGIAALCGHAGVRSLTFRRRTRVPSWIDAAVA